jgi:hypothetical protein
MTIQTKYDIEQRVWTIDQLNSFSKFEALERIIKEIQYSGPHQIVYKMQHHATGVCKKFFKESEIFSNKQEAIKSLLLCLPK